MVYFSNQKIKDAARRANKNKSNTPEKPVVIEGDDPEFANYNDDMAADCRQYYTEEDISSSKSSP